MSPCLHRCRILFLIVPFLISANNTTCVSGAMDSQYANCSGRFTCGIVSNVSFPFWGGNRADYCGLFNFELQCQENVPKLIVNSVTYRILSFDFTQQNLTVARDDYWNTICTSQYQNSSFDSTMFKLVGGLQDVVLLYNCRLSVGNFLSSSCNGSGTSQNIVYYGIWPVSGGVEGDCDGVVVPVWESYVEKVFSGLMKIEDALHGGFGLQWDVGNECESCINNGGECGYNHTLKKFTCFCRDGPCSGKSSSKAAIVGVAVAVAAVVGILLGCLSYFIVRRRKRIAERSKSNDPFTSPPSSFAVTSTTNMSQSSPSYPSSKFDYVPKSYYFGVHVFSCAELEDATNNFDPSLELGDGGFGTVYYGKLKDGREVAVKRHYESNLKRVEQFMNEVKILAHLRHNNLVTLYGCTSRHSRELLLVYEYIPNGTVADHLHGKGAKSTSLPWPIRMKIAVETAEALTYLHKSDVIHRDVKANNILLDNNFCVKVADFGLSRFYPNDVTHVSTAPQGTPGYVDPVYYQCFHLTDKSDVYSFGVVLVELISSLQAVDVSRHNRDINLATMAIDKIQNRALHELVDPYLGFETNYAVRQKTTAVAELVFRCLQQDRDIRPSMNEVLEVLREIQNREYVEEAEVSDKAEEIMPLEKVPSATL